MSDAQPLTSASGREELLATYRDGLLADILPFWLTHAVDKEHGGIMTAVDRNGELVDTDKGVWQQGRFTWLLGKLYNHVEANTEWLATIQRTLTFIDRHCVDPEDGRLWFHVDRHGQPIRKRRYAFSESFAAIAYGEAYRATGNAEYRQRATELFKAFIASNEGGCVPAKFTDVRPAASLGYPMIAIVTAQELRESIQLEDADNWIDQSIARIRNLHWKPDIACVMETVAPDGTLLDHFDGRTLNPGHAIEGAWFVMHEGLHRNCHELVGLGCQMLDAMWERGWDREHGGLLYFTSVDGRPVQEYWHDMKFWWPHNEAIIATLLAYLLTRDDKYAQWHQMVHDWTYSHFADDEHGEWFGYLHRDGSRSSSLKGNLWKGPFHLPRMQFYCWKFIEQFTSAPNRFAFAGE